MDELPYSIPEQRPLTLQERALLQLLLSKSAPECVAEIERLEVVARCGCGKCPTIMFHSVPEYGKGGERLVADFQDGDEASGLVGIMLWERNGEISELEAWSIDGKDVSDWPSLSTVRPLECSK